MQNRLFDMEESYLTAKQVQTLLNVDRTTIYRMLKDGRLQGVKVGQHWRFPESVVKRLVVNSKFLRSPLGENRTAKFPISCMQSVQDVFAEIAGVGALVCDDQGRLITELSNCCDYCRLILENSRGRQACTLAWKELGRQSAPRPVFTRCHAGLVHARAVVDVQPGSSANLVAGQFWVDPYDQLEADAVYRDVSQKYQIDLASLQQAGENTPVFGIAKISKIGGWMEKVAASFKQISAERGELISRLRQIAAMSLLENA